MKLRRYLTKSASFVMVNMLERRRFNNDEDDIITMMVGRKLLYPHEPLENQDEIFTSRKSFCLASINAHIKRVDNVSLVFMREILGVAGLVGSGHYRHGAILIWSHMKVSLKEIFLSIKTSKYQNCAQAIEHKIMMVPEDRKKLTALFLLGDWQKTLRFLL